MESFLTSYLSKMTHIGVILPTNELFRGSYLLIWTHRKLIFTKKESFSNYSRGIFLQMNEIGESYLHSIVIIVQYFTYLGYISIGRGDNYI